MDNMNFYEVLGVEKTATQDEIKAAYKKLAKQLHPDLQTGKSEAEKKAAEEKFKNVNTAYETLGDEEKRKAYDMGGNQGGMFGGFPGNAEDLFSWFSGRNGTRFRTHASKQDLVEKNGPDIRVKVKISLKDAIFGAKKKINIPVGEECPSCHGSGAPSSGKQPCKVCGGTGVKEYRDFTAFGISISQTVCTTCHGTGISPESLCKTCGGLGRVDKLATIEITVPPGAKTDHNSADAGYCIMGAGTCGVAGGSAGNLYVKFAEIPDELFEHSPVNPINLRTTCYVNPLLALTGGTIDVYTPGGMKKCKIPELTPAGKMFKIKNTWMQSDQLGDLEVIIAYDMPTKLTPKIKKALGKIIEADDFTMQNAKQAARLYNEFNK